MKKIKSLFARDYEGNRQVRNEVVPGSEWVLAGEGVATVKYDGTCCMVKDGLLHKRYDRKLTKAAYRKKKSASNFVPSIEDFKPAPVGWIAAEPEPNIHTGHWPGWLLVDLDAPENKWHKEAWLLHECQLPDGTYELVGPKINGNPNNFTEFASHRFWNHGDKLDFNGRTYEEIKQFLTECEIEGIVWHHPDGRMVKIKRRDFGLEWPVRN